MSIIFQLFSAEDLQKLTTGELGELSIAIREAFQETGLSKQGKLQLNLAPNVDLDDNSVQEHIEKWRELVQSARWGRLVQQWKSYAVNALLNRYNEVAQQLKTPPLKPLGGNFIFDAIFG